MAPFVILFLDECEVLLFLFKTLSLFAFTVLALLKSTGHLSFYSPCNLQRGGRLVPDGMQHKKQTLSSISLSVNCTVLSSFSSSMTVEKSGRDLVLANSDSGPAPIPLTRGTREPTGGERVGYVVLTTPRRHYSPIYRQSSSSETTFSHHPTASTKACSCCPPSRANPCCQDRCHDQCRTSTFSRATPISTFLVRTAKLSKE